MILPRRRRQTDKIPNNQKKNYGMLLGIEYWAGSRRRRRRRRIADSLKCAYLYGSCWFCGCWRSVGGSKIWSWSSFVSSSSGNCSISDILCSCAAILKTGSSARSYVGQGHELTASGRTLYYVSREISRGGRNAHTLKRTAVSQLSPDEYSDTMPGQFRVRTVLLLCYANLSNWESRINNIRNR